VAGEPRFPASAIQSTDTEATIDSIDVPYSSAGWTTDDESKHPLFTRSCRRDTVV